MCEVENSMTAIPIPDNTLTDTDEAWLEEIQRELIDEYSADPEQMAQAMVNALETLVEKDEFDENVIKRSYFGWGTLFALQLEREISHMAEEDAPDRLAKEREDA